jgi:hypothetical protein
MVGHFDGSIDGAPFHAVIGGAGAGPLAEGGSLQGGGMFEWKVGAGMTSGTGVLQAPSSFADPGSLYCVGSVLPDLTGETMVANLSRLGRCADAVPVSGDIEVCLGF